ncbi:MAG: type II secretion system protein [Phycisphaeraceae bacterium]|nr:type II secretion system protein [Phycisphaeraceae bacterium]
MSKRSIRRTSRAFTLIELLVVISVIALLVAILLPSLASARRAAHRTISLSNLKQLAVGIAAYSQENKDGLVNPFDARMQQLYGANWCDVVFPRDTNATTNPYVWRFNDPGFSSEMFSFHWASLIMTYIAPGQNRARIQIAPNDQAVIARFDAHVNATSDIDGYLMDTSYLYSPTMWLASERYAGSAVPPLGPDNAASPRWWRRNRTDHVTEPQAKVMLWERFDFGQQTRGSANGRVKQFPQWNNSEATPRFARVDGSVDSVAISQLNALTNDSDAAVRNIYTPASGLWRMPSSVLNRYSGIGRDGIENGENGTTAYPAYFWSTKNGIRGRDIPR